MGLLELYHLFNYFVMPSFIRYFNMRVIVIGTFALEQAMKTHRGAVEV
jgi:hypothetical protein